MPCLFIGHGNPMNAVSKNAFTSVLEDLGQRIPGPKIILCISAHWMSEGTWITHMPRPKTIHDFHGFPPELFAVQYPAPGSPKIAEQIQSQLNPTEVHMDDELWGLDHGTWSILRHMYPDAKVPVLQMSIYMEKPPDYHFGLGQQLRKLRDQGVLIVGSGNIVHNLNVMNWEPGAKPFEWATEFDDWVKQRIIQREYRELLGEPQLSRSGKLSVPSPDHWYPLLYALGASDRSDELRFEYEGIENGSISMRTLSFGMGE
jgi:4,5-DOPA dioxygenase extradiol